MDRLRDRPWPLGRLSFLGATGAVVVLLANAIASMAVVEVSLILGGAVVTCLAVLAPVQTLLGWLACGPTLSGFLSVKVGGLPALTPDRVLLLFLIATFCARVARRPGQLLPIGRMELAFGSFIAIAAVSAVVNGGTWVSPNEGGLTSDLVALAQGSVVPFAGFVLAKSLLRQDRQVRWLMYTLVCVGLLVGAVGILSQLTSTKLFTATRFVTAHALGQQDRAIGTVASPIQFGVIMSSTVIASLALLAQPGRLGRRLFLCLALAVGVVAVGLCKTRAVWLGLLVGLALMARYDPRLRRPLLVAGKCAVLGLIVALPIITSSPIYQNRLLDVSPIYNRVVLTATSLNMVADRPLFGYGFGLYSFLEHRRDYVVPVEGVPPEFVYQMGVPHNNFLHVLVLVGLVGFVPFMFFMLKGLQNAARVARHPSTGHGPGLDAAVASGALLAVYLVVGLFTDVIFDQFSAIQPFVLLGVVDGIRQRRIGGTG